MDRSLPRCSVLRAAIACLALTVSSPAIGAAPTAAPGAPAREDPAAYQPLIDSILTKSPVCGASTNWSPP